MAIKITLTDAEVQDIVGDYIETATVASQALETQSSYDLAYDDRACRKRVVAQALYLNRESGFKNVPIPKDFPTSRACIAYGFGLAAWIVLNR